MSNKKTQKSDCGQVLLISRGILAKVAGRRVILVLNLGKQGRLALELPLLLSPSFIPKGCRNSLLLLPLSARRMAPKLLMNMLMALRPRSRKILIPDVPPEVRTTTYQGMVIAGIGVLCVSAVIAAVLFVFLVA